MATGLRLFGEAVAAVAGRGEPEVREAAAEAGALTGVEAAG
jgi:hypothetical protein